MYKLRLNDATTNRIFNELGRVAFPHMTSSTAHLSDVMVDAAFSLAQLEDPKTSTLVDGITLTAFAFAVSRTGTYTSVSSNLELWVDAIKEATREPKFYLVTVRRSKGGIVTIDIDEDVKWT